MEYRLRPNYGVGYEYFATLDEAYAYVQKHCAGCRWAIYNRMGSFIDGHE